MHLKMLFGAFLRVMLLQPAGALSNPFEYHAPGVLAPNAITANQTWVDDSGHQNPRQNSFPTNVAIIPYLSAPTTDDVNHNHPVKRSANAPVLNEAPPSYLQSINDMATPGIPKELKPKIGFPGIPNEIKAKKLYPRRPNIHSEHVFKMAERRKILLPVLARQMTNDLEERYLRLKDVLSENRARYWAIMAHPKASTIMGERDPAAWIDQGRFDYVLRDGTAIPEETKPPMFRNPGPPPMEDIDPIYYGSRWSRFIYPFRQSRWPKKMSIKYWGPVEDWNTKDWLKPSKYYGIFEVPNEDVLRWHKQGYVESSRSYGSLVHFLDPSHEAQPLMFRVKTLGADYRFIGSSSHFFRPNKWLNPKKSYQVFELSVQGMGESVMNFRTTGKKPYIIDGTRQVYKEATPHIRGYVGRNGVPWLKSPPKRPKVQQKMMPRYFGPKELFHPEHWFEPGKEYRPYHITGVNVDQIDGRMHLHDDLQRVLFNPKTEAPDARKRMWRFEMHRPNAYAYGYYEMKSTPVRGLLGDFLPSCYRAKYSLYPLTPRKNVKPHVLYTNNKWPENPLGYEAQIERVFGPLPAKWQRQPKKVNFENSRKAWVRSKSLDEWHEPRLKETRWQWNSETQKADFVDPRAENMRWNPAHVRFDDLPEEMRKGAKPGPEVTDNGPSQQEPKHESEDSPESPEHVKQPVHAEEKPPASPEDAKPGPSKKALGKRPMKYGDVVAGPSSKNWNKDDEKLPAYDDEMPKERTGPSSKALGKRPMKYDDVVAGPSSKNWNKDDEKTPAYDDNTPKERTGPSEKALGKRPMKYDDEIPPYADQTAESVRKNQMKHEAEMQKQKTGPSEEEPGKAPVDDAKAPKAEMGPSEKPTRWRLKMVEPRPRWRLKGAKPEQFTQEDMQAGPARDAVGATPNAEPVRPPVVEEETVVRKPPGTDGVKPYRTGHEVVQDVLKNYIDFDHGPRPLTIDGKYVWVEDLDPNGPKRGFKAGHEWIDGVADEVITPEQYDDFIRDIPGFEPITDHPYWMSGALGDDSPRANAERSRASIVDDLFGATAADVAHDIHGVPFNDMIPASSSDLAKAGTKLGEAAAEAVQEVVAKSVGRVAVQVLEQATTAVLTELMGDGVLAPVLIAVNYAFLGQMLFDLVGTAVQYHHGKCSQERNACISDTDLSEHHCHSLHQCKADGDVCAYRAISPAKVVCDWNQYNAWQTATQASPSLILLKEMKVKIHRRRVQSEARMLAGFHDEYVRNNCSNPKQSDECHSLKEATDQYVARFTHDLQYTSLYKSPEHARKSKKQWAKAVKYTETVIKKDKAALEQAKASRAEMAAPNSRHTKKQQHQLDKQLGHAKHEIKKHLQHLKHMMKKAQKQSLKADALSFVDPYEVCDEDRKNIQMLYERAVNGTYAVAKKDGKGH